MHKIDFAGKPKRVVARAKGEERLFVAIAICQDLPDCIFTGHLAKRTRLRAVRNDFTYLLHLMPYPV